VRVLTTFDLDEYVYSALRAAKTHVGRLLAKLGARDRALLVMVTYETGLVRPGAGALHPSVRC
jgi:hypothetical protein